MSRVPFRSVFVRIFAFAFVILFITHIAWAQFERATPPIADPRDTRFKGVTEDWATPSLNTSRLRAVPPIRAYLNERPGYTVEFLQAQWRWGDPIDLYVLKPKGVKKPPVILYLYGYPTDTDMFKDEGWQRAATQDGMAGVGFVSALTGQRYHDRPMREWFLSELQESLATSAHDVQMLLNYLEKRGDLDTTRVGMFAQGSGASIAILASAADPRIKVLDVMDPWGDWPTWISTSPFVPKDERASYEKPEFLKKAAVFETVDWLPKIQAKRFRLQQNLYEPITPAKSKDKLGAAVPRGTTVVVYHTPQEMDAVLASSSALLGWMRDGLQNAKSDASDSAIRSAEGENPAASKQE
jgi:hypothetical protein